MTTEAVIIMLQVVIGLLSCYLIFYAQQKGKNQANKEDLKKLTEVVEEVKKKNAEEIELLKANLTILTDKKAQLFNEEKEALIIFFSKLHTWIWDSLNTHLNEYNPTNYSDLTNRIMRMRDAYNETNISFAKVQLLIKDNNLINTGNEAIIETLKLHHFIEDLIQRLSRCLSSEKILLEQITSDNPDFKRSVITHSFISQAKDNQTVKNEVWDEFMAKNKEIFGAAIIRVNDFKNKAKKYLND
ncbi:MAG: hypothetical protein ABI091_06375 [Ferruginibacter sp.]